MYINMMFLGLLVISAIVTMSASSWFTAWMGLEVNLMMMIPLMANKHNKMSSEASMKYFMTQTMASSFLMLGILILITPTIWNFNIWSSIIIVSSLATKLGAAPFHFWLPSTMMNLTWLNCILLMTWQKIAPLCLMMSSKINLTTPIIVLSTFIGALGGFNQTNLKKILAYSSIGHIGWMLTAMMINEDLLIMYFSLYSLMVSTMSLVFLSNNMTSSSSIIQSSKTDNTNMFIFLNMLSLGGLPPFLGFLPKWLVIENIMFHYPMLSIFLIITSLITLFYYVRLTYSSFLLINTPSILKMFQKSSPMNFILTTPSILGLPSFMYLY
uniref:NADH-ubiquinone oxidoreductase chain 2 n=1 Tax=Scolopocryptops sp. 1 YG-2013 TaxID=1285684 RepID=R4IVG3_9MYRI|nr:NAHD dehydrogenase subunit 2 [Scolopocryptops sp. 1 YG-2013]